MDSNGILRISKILLYKYYFIIKYYNNNIKFIINKGSLLDIMKMINRNFTE